jgi:hypothetical protein
MTEKICPECNGEGVVDQGTEDERRCPTCNGSGIVPDDGQGSEEVWNTETGFSENPVSERAMTASRIGKPTNRRCEASASIPAQKALERKCGFPKNPRFRKLVSIKT